MPPPRPSTESDKAIDPSTYEILDDAPQSYVEPVVEVVKPTRDRIPSYVGIRGNVPGQQKVATIEIMDSNTDVPMTNAELAAAVMSWEGVEPLPDFNEPNVNTVCTCDQIHI